MDKGLPEEQDYRGFCEYFGSWWRSENQRSNNGLEGYIKWATELLFTLYWIAPSIKEAASLFLKYRDDRFYSILDYKTEKQPYLLPEEAYFSRATRNITANSHLPSVYDFVPLDPRIRVVEDRVRDIASMLNNIAYILHDEPIKSLESFNDVDEELREWANYAEDFRRKWRRLKT